MSSITSTTTAAAQPPVPRAHGHGGMKSRMTATLEGEVSSGAISSTDATALTSALGSIDSSLSADASTAASTSGGAASAGTKLDPSSIKDRIDGLIADQVSSGALTSDQAGELKNLFASHGRSTQGTDPAGGAAGAGGPPPGPPPADADGDQDAAGGAAGAGGTASSTGTSASDLLATFMQQLQAAQTSGTGYAASGAGGTARASALLFDFRS